MWSSRQIDTPAARESVGQARERIAPRMPAAPLNGVCPCGSLSDQCAAPYLTGVEAAPDRADEVVPRYLDNEWPLFIVRMPPARLSPEAFAAHLTACRGPFHRLQPFAMLINMGKHPPLNATQRKEVSDAMKNDILRYPGLLRALAIVVQSAFERGIITAISWVARPPYSFAAFATEESAKVWLLARLAERATSREATQ